MYLQIVQIIVAIALIALLLFQVRGGGLGGIFGSPEPVYRTRRGVERTLFRVTVALIVIFIVASILSVGWDHWFGS